MTNFSPNFSAHFSMTLRVATISLSAILQIPQSWAGLADGYDLTLNPQARSYPAGGVVNANLGYAHLLWGEDPRPNLPLIGPPKTGSINWKYGYVRPVIMAQSALIMNRATLELEFFPVSIIGFAAGRGYHQRPKLSAQFDCNTYNCSGLLVRDTVRAQMVLGYAGFFSTFILRKEWITAPVSDRMFTDEAAGTLGNSGSDQLITKNLAVGYSKNGWTYAVNLVQAGFVQNKNQSLTSVFIVNRVLDTFGWVLGAGTFSSDHMHTGATFVGMLQYNIKRPIGLF